MIVDDIVVLEEVDFFRLLAEFLFSSSRILMTFSTTLSNVVFLAFFGFFKSFSRLFFLKALTATLTSRISSMPKCIIKKKKSIMFFSRIRNILSF